VQAEHFGYLWREEGKRGRKGGREVEVWGVAGIKTTKREGGTTVTEIRARDDERRDSRRKRGKERKRKGRRRYRAVGCAALAGRHAQKNADGGRIVALSEVVVEVRNSQSREMALKCGEGGREEGREGGGGRKFRCVEVSSFCEVQHGGRVPSLPFLPSSLPLSFPPSSPFSPSLLPSPPATPTPATTLHARDWESSAYCKSPRIG